MLIYIFNSAVSFFGYIKSTILYIVLEYLHTRFKFNNKEVEKCIKLQD
jgi:hypothetical protein